jgi:3-dehydroquinate synthase|tara:strand:- start:1079 stop:2068 length:990 start_codon:yes stop_codon:yes gene_type:complete
VKEVISDNYSIWIGADSLSKLDVSEYSKVAILVDENTKRDCLNKLSKADNSIIIEIKSGEKNKNISTCNFIWQELTNHNFDRNSLLINLGGGVIGDMGGFCASTYKRGIDFIQIPTTLLAMTDASIGGKLGIDFLGLKNQIGLFINPKSVLIYPDFLETLPLDQLKSGFVEVLKHALISDKNLWNKILNTPFEELNWNDLISLSVEIKNKIILSDSREKGERKKLNFGHTFGHAIESFYLQKDTPILHGQAIALGILIEAKMSNLSELEKVEITAFILSNFRLPHNPTKNQLLKFMRNDKKNLDEKINFTLLDGIGNCSLDNLFSEDEL